MGLEDSLIDLGFVSRTKPGVEVTGPIRKQHEVSKPNFYTYIPPSEEDPKSLGLDFNLRTSPHPCLYWLRTVCLSVRIHDGASGDCPITLVPGADWINFLYMLVRKTWTTSVLD